MIATAAATRSQDRHDRAGATPLGRGGHEPIEHRRLEPRRRLGVGRQQQDLVGHGDEGVDLVAAGTTRGQVLERVGALAAGQLAECECDHLVLVEVPGPINHGSAPRPPAGRAPG